MKNEMTDRELALFYAEQMIFTAQPDPDDEKSVLIVRTSPPNNLPAELIEAINDCAEYYQKMIFIGDFEGAEEEGEENLVPDPEFEDIFEELNYNLKKYKKLFIEEVTKSIGLYQPKALNSYAQAMLAFRKNGF